MAYRFTWIVPDLLAGMACPGYFTELEADLDYLAAEGVTRIVTLTEFSLALPMGSQFSSFHLPIADFGAPHHDQTAQFCSLVDESKTAGHRVAVHCLAGIGRTGTLLAAYLMWSNHLTAAQALTAVRNFRREYVQSVEQESYLQDWEMHLKGLERS
ncbi:MAG: dual specificity protein phosphatase family protein [Candidatus Sericytochromatia bacterium]|nr:dual specificity protein phosphatase family protein [Candidatus Sericytochromatia bacterium]